MFMNLSVICNIIEDDFRGSSVYVYLFVSYMCIVVLEVREVSLGYVV